MSASPRRLLTGLILVGWVVGVWADGASQATEPQVWLERMTRAVQSLNYDGVFVYLHGGQMRTMRITHTVSEEGERERLLSLDGPAQQVIRNGRSVTCILPDKSAVVLDHRARRNALPVVLPLELKHLTQVYNFRLDGVDRVIGRPVQILWIDPKDRYRYGYRIWLDQETGLPLKSHVLDERNQPVEQIIFTSLQVGDEVTLGQVTAEVPTHADSAQTLSNIAGQASASIVRVEKLPAGFQLTSHNRLSWSQGGEAVEHLVFSDGLASISVYVEDDFSNNALIGLSKMGALNAFGGIVADHHVTVMGKVPQAAARAIGESVELRDDD
jgi:sigma-E factor negative regulatory protein RseB